MIVIKTLNQSSKKNLFTDQYFEFREKHSTIDEGFPITNIIELKYCLDIVQVFDRVWHERLMHKLNTMVLKRYMTILTLYLLLE